MALKIYTLKQQLLRFMSLGRRCEERETSLHRRRLLEGITGVTAAPGSRTQTSRRTRLLPDAGPKINKS